MIKTAITIDEKPVHIPSGWQDVTMGMFILLMEPIDSSQLCSILTGLSKGTVEQLSEQTIEIIISPCNEWVGEKLPDVTEHSFKLPDDIQQMELARRINAEYMLKDCNFFVGFSKLLSIYLAASIEDEDIEKMWAELMMKPCIEVIAAGKQLFKQYQRLCEDEAKLPKPTRRNEEQRAGIKELDKFGIFAFVDGLAKGDILKHDEIYKQPYAKVMLKARMNTEVSNYQIRLSDIINKK